MKHVSHGDRGVVDSNRTRHGLYHEVQPIVGDLNLAQAAKLEVHSWLAGGKFDDLGAPLNEQPSMPSTNRVASQD